MSLKKGIILIKHKLALVIKLQQKRLSQHYLLDSLYDIRWCLFLVGWVGFVLL